MASDRAEPAAVAPEWLRRDPVRAEQSQRLWAMTPAQRITAMRTGRLSLQQCCEWAARRPDEVPLINGEFEFIAAYDAERHD